MVLDETIGGSDTPADDITGGNPDPFAGAYGVDRRRPVTGFVTTAPSAVRLGQRGRDEGCDAADQRRRRDDLQTTDNKAITLEYAAGTNNKVVLGRLRREWRRHSGHERVCDLD